MKLSTALSWYAAYLSEHPEENEDIPKGWFALVTLRNDPGGAIGAHIVDTDEEDEDTVGLEWVPVPAGSRVTVEYEA